eukprot:maker-scaffold296_size217904-snap-gene-1.18 protein:Tk03900 transcript:maker-scaffold296_size217904-snap-gene-1.18-mRNA-1 annotation:"NPYLR8"
MDKFGLEDYSDADIFLNNIFDHDGNISELNLAVLFDNNTGDGIGKVLDDFTKDFAKGDDQVSPLVFYLLSILYSIVIMIGFLGNAMILYAIMSKGALRTARNYFIVILALSDLLLCVMTMPLTLWDVLSRKWPFGEDLEWLCQLAHSCQGIPVFMSSMAIVAIAADRYRCIMQPERPQFSANTSIYLSIFMGVFAVILSLPMFLTARVKPFIVFPVGTDMENILICQDTWEGSSKVVYTIVSSCAQFLLPFTVVIAIYLSIFFRLRNRPRSQHKENNNKRKRANMMIMAITLIFFVSWLPLNLFSFMIEIFPHVIRKYIEGSETVIYSLFHLFGLCNACINPILYGYLNENFRKEYKKIYRQMPWYSTSSHHQPAFHLHIMTPQQHELMSQNALAMNYNNNNTSSNPGQTKPCLVITTSDSVIDPTMAASSILQAARRLSLAVNLSKPLGPEIQRKLKRRMTLHGVGEVSIETAYISENPPSPPNRAELAEPPNAHSDPATMTSSEPGSHRAEVDDDRDMNCEETEGLCRRREELHVILVSGSKCDELVNLERSGVWRQLSTPTTYMAGDQAKMSYEYRSESRSAQLPLRDSSLGGARVKILSVGSFRSTIHRKFSIPALFGNGSLSKLKFEDEGGLAGPWPPHRYLYMDWKSQMVASVANGDGKSSHFCHPVDLEGLEETPVCFVVVEGFDFHSGLTIINQRFHVLIILPFVVIEGIGVFTHAAIAERERDGLVEEDVFSGGVCGQTNIYEFRHIQC